MKQIIRDYFTFNKREKNGIFVLICIILLLLLCIHFSEKFTKREVVDFSKFEKQLQALNAVEQKEDHTSAINEKTELPTSATPIQYFKFDPNGLSKLDWKRLGLTDKQIHSIKNYESKGGTFRSKTDVKKMYAISPALYAALEPYIQIIEKQKPETVEKSIYTRHAPELKLIEINSADSVQLATLKGIGPFYSKMIIKYRTLLGGFYKKEQLLEVWKMNEEKYKEIEKYIYVDTLKIKKIDINTCTSNDLKRPYCSWKVANGIISYRAKHGDFYTVNDLIKTNLLDSETLLKMAPYLKTGK
ncbi:MAG TPA: helix-hairpin-helix domain-containing protein [Bacteroidia bacterium]|jgi:DNA uptake protein ComE-like DNA-binding protein|nr:helix-hairpin-helix domain-containing protein [Bacteroidia bacterium]